MTDWFNEFNGSFFLSIGTMLFAFMGLSVRYCYYSKCSQCSLCWGFIDLVRDVNTELKEDMVLDNHKETEEKV